MKIQIQRKVIKDFVNALEKIYPQIYDELTNTRDFETVYNTAGLMELDKSELDDLLDLMVLKLKQIKAAKPFNHKHPVL